MKKLKNYPTFMIWLLVVMIFTLSCSKDTDLFYGAMQQEYPEIEDAKTSDSNDDSQEADGEDNQESDEEDSQDSDDETPADSDVVSYTQAMFTDTQINMMVDRITNGFAQPGTNGEDINRMVNEAANFLGNPSVGRLDWMPSGSLEACGKKCNPYPVNLQNRSHEVDDNIFYSGIYAFILANRNKNGDAEYAQKIANAIAIQTLARAQDPNLNFNDRGRWLTGVETAPFFTTIMWLEKTMNNWSLIKSMDLVTELTADEEELIEDWFAKGNDYVYDKLNGYYRAAFGSNWKNAPVSTGYNKPIHTTNPTIAIEGVTQDNFETNFAAQLPHANIPSKYASFLHYYGLIYKNQRSLYFSKEWYKLFFQLAVYPDGTSTELYRAKADIPDQGLQYWCITMSTLTSIAHSHAVAVLQNNPIVQGESYSYYFDYTTSKGISDYLPSHTSSDTKGGQKGLQKFLEAFSKYLGQSTGLNGWGEIRRVNTGNFPPHQMTDKFHYMIPLAQANAYYNDGNLKGAYSGTNGYQRPMTKAEGAKSIGPWRESYMGGFGKYLVGFPYLETEGLYNR